MPTVDWVLAAVRIAPRVGPVHGSHATANARPAITGPPVEARLISELGRHSRFSRGTNIAAMNRNPITISRIAATWRRVARWSWSVRPRPVALIPSATNITVNERQKSSAGPTTRTRPFPSASSANVTPEIAER